MAQIILTAKRVGSLLPVIIDQEITDTQLMAIQEILENDRMAFNVVEDGRISRILGGRLEGIDQYQAESR